MGNLDEEPHMSPDALDFPSIVHQHFDALLGRYGFQGVTDNPRVVIFESPAQSVRIILAPMDHELSFDVKFKTAPDIYAFTLGELLACAGVADEDLPSWMPYGREALEEGLAEMASYVADVADRYLAASTESLEYLIPCRQARNAPHKEKMRQPDRWREEAAAWQAEHPDLV